MARGIEVAGRFGVPRAYDSYDDLLADDDIDVVYLCTPNALHADQTIRAAKAGKHVLVEKPMTFNPAEGEEMVNTCEANRVRLGVGFHLRHHAAQQEAKTLLREGRLGKPVTFEMTWVAASDRRDGWWQDPEMVGAYILGARGVHLIDLVCYLSGREPEAVVMMTDGQRPNRPLEETVVALLRLGDDSFGSLVATRLAAGSQNEYRIRGSAATLHAVGTIGPHSTGTMRLVSANSITEMGYEATKNPYVCEVEAFNQAILDGTEPNASGLDGLRVARICEALLGSARTGKVVSLR